MNLYFVFAAEGKYEGLHGMYDYAFEEAANEEELYDMAREMSIEVMESYGEIGDTLQAEAEEEAEFQGYEPEDYDAVIESILDELYEDNVYFYIVKLDPQYSVAEYEEIIARDGPEEMLKYRID